MSEFRPVMPFPKTQVEMSPRSNRGACRATPVWKPVILNAWSIQISATVARFRGNVRSRWSGSMPLIVGEEITWLGMHNTYIEILWRKLKIKFVFPLYFGITSKTRKNNLLSR